VFWLPIEGADFKGRRFSTTLTQAACTIVGRKVDCSFRQPAGGLGKGALLLRSDRSNDRSRAADMTMADLVRM
jgi:hypothetical protein